jgi:CheY-like chemotaxis protein
VLDLNSVLEDMLPMLQRLIGENIALRTELGSHLGYARADRSQLEQVIMNLTVNARDAMPDGGQLLFRTSCCTVPTDVPDSVELGPGEYVMLAVSDTGTGMSSEVQSHIFEPFFTTKGEGLGTGLGLSTVYGIVEQSGGVIEVESALGQGTTFVVYLPQAERAAPVIHAPEEQSISEGSETILLVEDEDRVRTLAARMLKQQGYTLLTASNAQEAIEICSGHSHPIDLLLTDVIMPGENGVELARKIQAQHEGIRVLYISGYTDDTIGNKGAFEPGVTLLQKPFSPAELAGMVREVLDAP